MSWKMSMFWKRIKYTGIRDLLKDRGKYQIFLSAQWIYEFIMIRTRRDCLYVDPFNSVVSFRNECDSVQCELQDKSHVTDCKLDNASRGSPPIYRLQQWNTLESSKVHELLYEVQCSREMVGFIMCCNSRRERTWLIARRINNRTVRTRLWNVLLRRIFVQMGCSTHKGQVEWAVGARPVYALCGPNDPLSQWPRALFPPHPMPWLTGV